MTDVTDVTDVTAEPSPEAQAVSTDRPRGGFGSLGSIIHLLVLAWAAGIATFPLNDNSFFTHLATGRLILESGSIPSTDPYTFTAFGEPWTVQSWLASVAYAGFERAAGMTGIKVLVLAVMLAAATLTWRLTRAAESVILRMSLGALALFVAGSAWGERPYMIGVVGIGVVLLVLDGRIAPGWILPLMWIWANAHGSYPFAILLVALVIVGEICDQRKQSDRIDVRSELRALGAVVIGTLLAVAGPLGISVLTFPSRVVSQSGILSQVKEWQPPDFQSVSDRLYLVLVALALLSLTRSGRWRHALPVVFFVCASLVARRNIPLSVMVLLPAMAAAAPVVGALRSGTRPALGRPFAVLAVGLLVVTGAFGVLRDDPGLDRYPTRQMAWLGPKWMSDVRIAMQERNGNLVEVLDGPDVPVFFDDRFDMFPRAIAEDYLTLLHARPGWDSVLERHAIEMIVWERDQPLVSVIVASPGWQVVHADTGWVVACRRDTDGRCRTTD